MQDLEAFLSTELHKLPEFQPGSNVRPRKYPDALIQPDANGNIYEICGLCGVTLDCVGHYSDAEHIANRESHTWSFYQIWQINTNSGERVLISQREIRRTPNPLGHVAHNAALLMSQKGKSGA